MNKKMKIQKMVGIATLIFSGIVIKIAPAFLDGDITAVLFTIPIGIACLVSKKLLLTI